MLKKYRNKSLALTLLASTILIGGCQSQAESPDESLDRNVNWSHQSPLELAWLNAWSSSIALNVPAGAPLDLEGWQNADGVLSFQMKVEDLSAGDLKLLLKCGANCQRSVELTGTARDWSGRGWQNVSVPARCFTRADDSFAEIGAPFVLEGAGTGRVLVQDIDLESDGSNSIGCLEPEALPVTPAPLNAHWALEWWMPRHEEKLARVQQGDVDLVMIGDSITHGWEDAGKVVWDQYFASRNAINLGFSGDRTENVLWRLEHGEVDGISPKLAVLMIGTNNAGHRQEPAEYTANGIATIVDQLKDRLPSTHILVLGIFPRAEDPSDPLRQLNRQTNSIIEQLAQDERVSYLNINDAFLDENGKLSENIMPDLLHPNENGYHIWAAAMEPIVAELMGE